MKKLLTILGAVGLSATGASALVSCGEEKKIETQKVSLESIVVIKNIEVEKGKNKDPEAILSAVKALNPKLNEDKIKFAINFTDENKIMLESLNKDIYKDSVELFVVEKPEKVEEIDLNSIIDVKKIELEKNKLEDEKEVLAAIKKVNPKLKESNVKLKLSISKEGKINKVTLEAVNQKVVYKNLVEFIITEKPEEISLDKILKNRQITLEKNKLEDEKEILLAIREANPELKDYNFDIKVNFIKDNNDKDKISKITLEILDKTLIYKNQGPVDLKVTEK